MDMIKILNKETVLLMSFDLKCEVKLIVFPPFMISICQIMQ